MSEVPFLRQWMLVIRRIRLGRTVKAVATMLATYADPDGSRVYPGVARLSYECETSPTTVKKALARLRKVGLIEKVGRRGDADEYRLILADDLLERVYVPTPAQVDVELERIRAVYRGTYAANLRTPTRSADAIGPDSLRTVRKSAEVSSADAYSTGESESADAYSTGLRTPERSATYQDVTLTTTDHSGEDLSTDLAVSRARADSEPTDIASRPRCPHGRSIRRNRQGQPRCDACRSEETNLSVATAAEFKPRCDAHGLPAHQCVFCRRGLPGAAP